MKPPGDGSGRSNLHIALRLPPFLWAVFVMYWSLAFAVLAGRVRIWQLHGRRHDAWGWATTLRDLFGIRVRKLPGPQLYKKERMIYLCNHRSWGDFFIEVLATDGYALLLSRWAVFFVFPMFMGAVKLIRSVILFKRGAVHDKEAFNRFIDAKLDASPVNALVVFPEGHRSTRRASLPLKRGMMAYAYSRKLAVQIIITANKEAVINEKLLEAHFGQTIVIGYSEVVRSAEYDSFDKFVEEIQRRWDAEWQRVYSADPSEGTEVRDYYIEDPVYPWHIRLLQVPVSGLSVLCFFAACYWLVRGALAALALAGPWQPLVVAALAGWVTLSFHAASRPIRCPPPLQPASNGAPSAQPGKALPDLAQPDTNGAAS